MVERCLLYEGATFRHPNFVVFVVAVVVVLLLLLLFSQEV